MYIVGKFVAGEQIFLPVVLLHQWLVEEAGVVDGIDVVRVIRADQTTQGVGTAVKLECMVAYQLKPSIIVKIAQIQNIFYVQVLSDLVHHLAGVIVGYPNDCAAIANA